MARETVPIRSEVVNRARLHLGLNKSELYRRTGCDCRTGTKFFVNGHVQLGTARRLAEALGVNVADIADLEALGG